MNELKEIEVLSEMDIVKQDEVIKFIKAKILHETGFSTTDLVVKTRIRRIVEARQLAMYFIKHNTKYPLRLIGDIYKRKHATVLHANKTINNLADTEKRLREMTDRINKDVEKFKRQQALKITEIKKKEAVFIELLNYLDVEDKESWLVKYAIAK